MKPPFAATRMLHGFQQYRMPKELAIPDHQIDARNIHVHDAPCTDVQMPDLAIAHLPLGQSDKWPAGVNQGVWIVPQQAVVRWLARKSDCVGVGFGPIPPAVENDQNERFRTRHRSPSTPDLIPLLGFGLVAYYQMTA